MEFISSCNIKKNPYIIGHVLFFIHIKIITMKNFWKMLAVALLGFVFLGGGRGLFSSAQVDKPSQTFDLWTNVDGVWDQGTQILTVQPRWAGTGQIVAAKWNTMVNTLSLKTEEIAKVEFKQNVWFPDDSDGLFADFKSQIIFPLNQYNIQVMCDQQWGCFVEQ